MPGYVELRVNAKLQTNVNERKYILDRTTTKSHQQTFAAYDLDSYYPFKRFLLSYIWFLLPTHRTSVTSSIYTKKENNDRVYLIQTIQAK